MQEFYIKKDSVLPILSMELIFDGRHTYNKFHDAIQAADITFTMTNIDNGIIKIANAPCYIKLKENTNCVDEYLICYNWKKRDTKEKGIYEGEFTINFSNDLTSETTSFPNGELIIPIREKLIIKIE